MKCEANRELFSDFIDDELSEEQSKALKNHLRSCEACSEELGKFRRAQSLLRLLPKEEAPSELWEAIELEVSPAEDRLIFFLQSVSASERFRPRRKPSAPVRIYGISFGNLRRK